MTDHTIKSKNPWAKFFVINSGEPKLDDAAKARIETCNQLQHLKQKKRAYSSRILK